MAIKDVLFIGNPKLRRKSEELRDFGEKLSPILTDLKDTLNNLQKTKKIGRALAAPQINHMKKVIYFNLLDKSFFMVNPNMIWKSEEKISIWDSCFCFDVAFFVQIDRHKSIKVRYRDENGNEIFKQFEDDMSELVQHEIDHLNGILATDYLKDNKKIVMRNEWEARYKK
jgi:peptide deformylase